VRQNSIAVGVKAAVGRGGFLFEAGEAEEVMGFSVRFRMVMKVDARISKFGYLTAVKIEMEANYTLEIRDLAPDDELMVATIKPATVEYISVAGR